MASCLDSDDLYWSESISKHKHMFESKSSHKLTNTPVRCHNKSTNHNVYGMLYSHSQLVLISAQVCAGMLFIINSNVCCSSHNSVCFLRGCLMNVRGHTNYYMNAASADQEK